MPHPMSHDRTSKILPVLLAGLLVLLASGIAGAEPGPAALGQGGELLRLETGTWSSLFPGETGNAWALAFERTGPGGVVERLAVPGTGDARQETAPRVIHDSDGGASILLWHSVGGDGLFQLRFATLDRDGDTFEISPVATLRSGDVPILFDQPPLLAVTRESFELEAADEGGDVVEARYTVVHLLWRTGGETPALHYAALTFVEGRYVGWHEVLDLSAFLAAPEDTGDSAPALPAGLAGTLDLAVSADHHTLLVTWANPLTQRVGSLAIRALPLALSVLGDEVRDAIYGAADLFDPSQPTAFADKIKGSIIAIGNRTHVHPAVSEYLADRLGGWLEASSGDYGWSEFVALGEDARDLSIDLASSVHASTIEDPSAAGTTVVEIDLGGFLGDPGAPAPAQLIDLTERANLPAPAVGAGELTAPPEIFTSGDGTHLVVAWRYAADEDLLHYVESVEGGTWSTPRQLALSEALDLVQARGLLAELVH